MIVQRPIGIAICEASVMNSGLRVSPVPWRPPVYTSATVMKKPDTEEAKQDHRDDRDIANVRVEDPKQRVGDHDKHEADDGGHGEPDAGGGVNALNRAFGVTGAKVLSGNLRQHPSALRMSR